MIGIPDYETYVAHRRANHPQEPIMIYVEFSANASGRVTPWVRVGSGAAARR